MTHKWPSEKRDMRNLCTPPPRTERADRQRLVERFKSRKPIHSWRLDPSLLEIISTLMPDALPNSLFADLGIVFQLTGFPTGFTETDLANYDQIVDAFSHCFNPRLFDAINLPDPYAAWPYQQTYWDGLFKILNPAGYLVQVSMGGQICFGTTGEVQESGPTSFMQIFDCTGAADIFHEIGHLVMDFGILRKIPPIYYNYATGTVGLPGGARIIDAIVELNRLFGNYSETRVDTDGLKFGFVSDYAMTNKHEDFAETFKYYVYFSDDAYSRASRQEQQNSTLLGDKMSYVSALYKGMVFRPGGVVDSWPGYPL